MVYSTHDMMALVAELNIRRIPMVYGARQRKAGGRLMLTDRQLANLTTARQLHHRYLRGDYRHDERELGRVIELCHQLIEWHAETNGHTARHPAFDLTSFEAKVSVGTNVYPELMQKITEL